LYPDARTPTRPKSNTPGHGNGLFREESRVSRKNYLFTSESVSEGHPDKVCDQISDAILDAFLANDIKLGIEDDSQTNTRLGCETLTTTNKIVIAGECRGRTQVGGGI